MNILTFDVEDWFHLLDNESTDTTDKWKSFPSRIHRNMDRIFGLLDEYEQRATFFVLGWIAQQYPDMVRRIRDKGFEIGYHTDTHRLIHAMNPDTFYLEMKRGLDRIENITGNKVVAFRAPGFSLTESCNWAFDILTETGIRYDSSIFPIRHAHGGYPSFPYAEPTLIKTANGALKEFPVNAGRLFGKPIVYSGGGYFRLLPYRLIEYLSKKDSYIMSYLHPRDMDAEQPVIKDLPLSRKFKSYVGLKSCRSKLERWIRKFPFTDIATVDSTIDWNKSPVFDMNRKELKVSAKDEKLAAAVPAI
jgi:polysaccharide deacetylase family protein (PEP-CTERM system associated)